MASRLEGDEPARGAGIEERVGRAASEQRTVGVVLAAGQSERLSRITMGGSKAVLSFGGVSLVERAVRTLHVAGVDRVVVVAGHDSDSVKACVARTGAEVVIAPDWELGNGASLAATESLIADDERLVVLCADHVFAEGVLDEMLRSSDPAVLIDPSPSAEVWGEGTRVRIHSGRAVAFGKTLGEAAVDCGAFVLSKSVFSAYRSAAARGDHTLAGAISELTEKDRLRAVAIPAGSWWQDIDTVEDLKSARTHLRRSLVKDSDGIIAKKLNRPISTRLTMALAPLRLSPNLLSVITFAMGVWAAWALSAGRGIQGGLLIQLSSILDGSDGETARLQRRASARGAEFDGVLDRMVDAAIYAGLWLWILHDPSREYRLAVLFITMLAWGVVSTSLRDATSAFDLPRSQETRLVALFGGRDTRMLLLALGAMLGVPLAAIAAALAVYVLSGLWRVFTVLTGRAGRASPHEATTVEGVPGARVIGRGANATSAHSPKAAAANRRRAATSALVRTIRIGVFPLVVIAVFVVVVPRLADLGQVWALIRSLPWTAVAVLAVLALWNLVTYWPFVMVSMPGLSFWQAAIACQSSTTVAMTVPAGGAVAVGVSYAMYASWGFDATAIAGSTVSTFVVGMAIKLLLPAIAVLALTAQGYEVAGVASVAALGAALLVVSAMLVPVVLRGGTIMRIGRAMAASVNWIRRVLRMSTIPDLERRIAAFRTQLGTLLRDRWLELSATGILSQLSIFVVMLVTLRLMGVDEQEIGWAEALAVFASVRVATSVPIVPGNVGFAELGYIGGLLLLGGERTEVVGAVLLFRFLTFFIQIPIGAVTLLAWRGRRMGSGEPVATHAHQASG